MYPIIHATNGYYVCTKPDTGSVYLVGVYDPLVSDDEPDIETAHYSDYDAIREHANYLEQLAAGVEPSALVSISDR